MKFGTMWRGDADYPVTGVSAERANPSGQVFDVNFYAAFAQRRSAVRC